MDQCNQCHHKGAEQPNFKCETCHITQLNANVGEVSLMKEAMPSAMREAGIVCADCHVTERKQVTRAVAPACIGCHDKAFADTLWVWQARGDSLALRAQAMLNVLKPGTEAYQQLNQFVTLLREDGSRTAHNPYLFARWMERRQATP